MRIDSFTPALNTSYEGSDILSKLKPGDSIRAQLLENSGKELTLKFSDGTIVTAAAATPVETAEGEFVNLTFKGYVDDRPAFETAEKALQPQTDKAFENIRNSLTALKLPLTEQNLQMAKALTDQNLPVTSENMTKMNALITANTDLKPDAAAFLTAAKLSEDTNNIDKLQSLLAGRLKISNDISQLVKLIEAQAKGTADASLDSGEISKLVQKILASLAEKGEITKTSDGTGTSGGANPGIAAENIDGPAVDDGLPAIKTNGNSAKTDTLSVIAENQNKGADSKMTASSSITLVTVSTTVAGDVANEGKGGEINPAGKPADSEAALSSKGSSSEINTTGKASSSEEIAATKASVPEGKTAEKSGVSENSLLTRANNSSDSANSQVVSRMNATELKAAADKLISMLKGETEPGRADLPLISAFDKELNALKNSGELSGVEMTAAKQLAGEETLFATAVKAMKNMFIRIDEASENINPVKLYKEMDTALQMLKSTMQQLPQVMREAAAAIINNLESNVNFINQLNTYSSYVQLPLSIFSQNTTGELYMLKKGSKSKKLDPSNMTVLISLDTNNIGRIDTLLSVDRKNISTNFRLENSEVFPVLKEHHKQLYNSLLEKGFRLVDFTYRLMDEPINIVNFEAEAKKEFIKSSNNIDVLI